MKVDKLLTFFSTLKEYWLRKNKNTLKKKFRLLPDSVKKTVGD